MNFDLEKTVSYWREGAEEALGGADVLFKGEKYPFALFFGHLALEKILKALVVKKTKTHVERTHSLPKLASETGIEIPEETGKKLKQFMEFYQEGRYPAEKMEFHKKCTKEYAEQNMNEIKEIFVWLKEKL